MGGQEVVERTITPQDIINHLNDLFAYCLSIGMTYEQYWYDDPALINAYLKAEEYRTQRRNQEMWLQGLYVYVAIGDLIPVLNPFSKDHKAKPYLSKPLPITRREQEEEERSRVERITHKLDNLVGKKIG